MVNMEALFGMQVKASYFSEGVCILVELSLYLIKLQTNNSVYFLTSLHEYNRRKSIKVVLLHQSKVIYNTRQTKKIEIFSENDPFSVIFIFATSLVHSLWADSEVRFLNFSLKITLNGLFSGKNLNFLHVIE